MYNQAIVIDNGTALTKMGYAGNVTPDFVIPTNMLKIEQNINLNFLSKNNEYNYYIGDEAIKHANNSENYKFLYPMKNGIIENWDLMEKYWHTSIYNYLKCDPQEHYFVLTESLMNLPENRETIAEIFFDTFNVPGLYIGLQAFFAFFGYSKIVYEDSDVEMDFVQEKAIKSLTGLVVDSGDSETHIVPICDGFVDGSNIRHIPVAGRKITKFMEQMIKKRGEKICNEDLYFATTELKEKYGYLTKDLLEEFSKFDKKMVVNGKLEQSCKFKKFEGVGKISKVPFSINIGYEVFLGPESVFYPEIIEEKYKSSLDESIDLAIQASDFDYRRRLYANIVTCGGNTLFKNFDKKLECTLQNRVNERFKKSNFIGRKNVIKVKVTDSMAQKHIAWLGASWLSSNEIFKSFVHTREEYTEKGPSCFYSNPIIIF